MKLFDYQREAIEHLSSGKALVGGTGSGKSITAIAWYFEKLCGGKVEPRYVKMKTPRPLYIITTAKKRDDFEWNKDLSYFMMNTDPERNLYSKTAPVVVDSWNNIKRYITVKDAVFIFDEQRLVGSGAWVKAFYKIAENNDWILLTATPGDSFKDYIPLFVANGYYRNKSHFEQEHVEWDRFSKFPKYKKIHNTAKLLRIQRDIIVKMNYKKPTKQIHKYIECGYNKELMDTVRQTRFDPFKNEPIQQAAGLCYVMRKISNSDISRIEKLVELFETHKRIIIFYNFDYELEMLREGLRMASITFSEWNGKRHEQIPKSDSWAYLVQYNAGNEGWNCITCDCMVHYSLNYSYKVNIQASGRIDRNNTPFENLYYYHLYSNSIIDRSILDSNKRKKKFNEKVFAEKFA